MTHLEIGKQGEDAACTYLRKQHLQILARNVFFGKYEIDLIFREKSTLVFAEVKTRSLHTDQSTFFPTPAAAVTPHKQRNIIAAARTYIQQTDEAYSEIRFDVLAVYATVNKHTGFLGKQRERFQVLHIEHMRGAFELS